MNIKNKNYLLSVSFGMFTALLFLILHLLFSTISNNKATTININESLVLSSFPVGDKESLLATTLSLFGLQHNNSNNEFAENDSMISLLENVTVKIIAQAFIGEQQNLMLEVITPEETKRIVVQEGTVIDGILIKKIMNKHLIIEKDEVEYNIRLFHPQELQLTKSEQ